MQEGRGKECDRWDIGKTSCGSAHTGKNGGMADIYRRGAVNHTHTEERLWVYINHAWKHTEKRIFVHLVIHSKISMGKKYRYRIHNKKSSSEYRTSREEQLWLQATQPKLYLYMQIQRSLPPWYITTLCTIVSASISKSYIVLYRQSDVFCSMVFRSMWWWSRSCDLQGSLADTRLIWSPERIIAWWLVAALSLRNTPGFWDGAGITRSKIFTGNCTRSRRYYQITVRFYIIHRKLWTKAINAKTSHVLRESRLKYCRTFMQKSRATEVNVT